MSQRRQIALLGSTGSIGRSTLDVLSRHPDRFRVYALSANSRDAVLLEQCRQCEPEFAVLMDEAAAARLESAVRAAGLHTTVLQGPDALGRVASEPSVDTVVAAIVGAAGLMPTLTAARAGKRVLLANKEALVMSGQLLLAEARRAGALILPVDSEHNAIFQSLPATDTGVSLCGVDKIVLTASGGPFRQTPLHALAVVTPQQALKHPNWSMGPKITIDSATLMNKGLEVIEACQLFDLSVDRITVLVHPESIIHSMVSYRDGSIIAQLGRPDMRTPIAHALAWPERIDSGVQALDFSQVAGLHFEPPDFERFPALRLAIEAQRRGGTAPTVLNAANEVAVAAFLEGRVSFIQLTAVVEEVLSRSSVFAADELNTIIEADREARLSAARLIQFDPAYSRPTDTD